MKQLIIPALLLGVSAAAVAENPRWLRNTAISPDGKTVAFTYKGDIFTVPVSGGQAKQLTTSPAYDNVPLWSPDGKSIVFSSDREGSADIYVMPAEGGTPVRVTTNSAAENPLAFLDNNRVLYASSLMPSVETSRGFLHQTYVVDVTKPSPRPEMYLSLPMMSASVNSKGDVLYGDRKGVENMWRKHERSSATSDIMLYSGGKFTKLTDFNGHDLNPVWKKDGKGYYYISEEDGTLNVFENTTDGKGKRQLTNFKKHPVRSLSASDNGTLAFSWDGDIYTMVPGGKPQKLAVTITGDQYDSDKVKYFPRSGATTMAVSPDGSEVAFVIRGDIYVTDTKYETTKRITNTPAQERNVDFAPDGKSLVYDSDRNG